MTQLPHDEVQLSRKEFNDRVLDLWPNLDKTMLGIVDDENHSSSGPSSLIIPYDTLDWVPIPSPDFEDEWCCTSLAEGRVYPDSPACLIAAPLSNDPYHNAMMLAAAEEELEDVRDRERTQTSVIEAQAKQILDLSLSVTREQNISRSLGQKLSDLFVVTTQTQQHQLDKLQERLLDLQGDAECCRSEKTWRDLQQKLHDLNHKFDGYIEPSTPRQIYSGKQTDELTLFLGGMLGDITKMWKDLEKLEGIIDHGEYIDENPQDGEAMCERVTTACMRPGDADAAEKSFPFSDILDRYYGFSRLHRLTMEMRKKGIQKLLDKLSTELSRLQADLTYEVGRTANLRTRVVFWTENLGDSKVKFPFTLLENLEMKQLTLERGSKELEAIVQIILGLPSRFHIIDIRGPEEREASTQPASANIQTKEPSGDAVRAVTAGQRDNATYIAELEAKLKEMQANEQAWAAHFESLHRRENEAKAATKKQLDSMELKNKELQKVITVVTGKLFQRRERLWDLSTTTRQLGEELISTLEQLGVSCDKPQVYDNEW